MPQEILSKKEALSERESGVEWWKWVSVNGIHWQVRTKSRSFTSLLSMRKCKYPSRLETRSMESNNAARVLVENHELEMKVTLWKAPIFKGLAHSDIIDALR